MNSDIQEWLPPSDPAVFESLCLDLWKDIWQDASAQKNGGRGQNQDGVDVFGQFNGKWIGVQCKQKDGLLRTRVKPSELENEVKDACKFSPALHQFILATTGVRDAKVQERARQLTEQHKTKGLFSVEVWSWREIWPELCNRPNLLNRIGPQYWPHFFQKPLLAIHQLPPLPVLIGRDEELAVVEKILLPAVPCGVKRLSKWIGLQGMGGVGKTAFATALAHRFKDVYSDAQLYFDLRGADKERRLSAKCTDAMRFIIRTFHPNGLLPENQDELTALYRSVLSDAGRVLLLFDNAADAEQIRPLLPPPNCLLIVTSRKHFTLPGLIMHTIDCLKPDKAQELLVTNAPRINGCEKEAAALCGYLPLALIVFVGIVNYHTITELRQLLDDLRKRLKRLDAVDAAFEISYEMLSIETRRRWCLLSVFPSNFNSRAASAVWGKISYPSDPRELVSLHAAPLAETEKELQALVNASLVEWDNTIKRFRLHNLIRQFCDSKLSVQQRTESHYCHSANYFEVLREANDLFKMGGKDSARGLALFDSEIANISYGHGWAIDSFRSVNFSNDNLYLKKAVAIACSGYPCIGATLFALRLAPETRVSVNDAGLRAAREIGDIAAEGSNLRILGTAFVEMGETMKAISCFKEGYALAQKTSNIEGKCNALGNLAASYSMLGENEIAKRYCEDELSLRIETSDRKGEGAALCMLGIIYAALHSYDKAIDLYNQQIQIAREGGYLRDEVVALSNMGTAYRELGQSEKAIECLERAVNICHQLSDIKSEGSCLASLANVYVVRNEPEKAVRLYEQSLDYMRAVGDIRGIAKNYEMMARAYLQLKTKDKCVLHAQKALQIYEQIHDPAAYQLRDIIANVSKLIPIDQPKPEHSKPFMEIKNIHYYSYHVKMQDLRGGFPGFLSKSRPPIVDGVAHLLLVDGITRSEQQIRTMVQMMGDEIVKPGISRPFTGEEFDKLPHKYKEMLQQNGQCIEAIPHFSSSIKPFSATK